MKKVHFAVLLGVILFAMSSCNQTRYITERYVKNNIEKHTEGNFSNIRTYKIYRGGTANPGRYLELTGYKYNGNKGLVIGTDRVSKARKKFVDDNTYLVTSEFTELTFAQAQSILDQYKILVSKLKSEKVIKEESVYHDYTVSTDVFISFKKTKSRKGDNNLNIWIRGEKYTLSLQTTIKRLQKFVKY